MIGSLIVLCGTIAITTFANSLPMLLVGQLLSGLPWGTLNVIAREFIGHTLIHRRRSVPNLHLHFSTGPPL